MIARRAGFQRHLRHTCITLLAGTLLAGTLFASTVRADSTYVAATNASGAPSAQPVDIQFQVTRTGDLGYDALVRYHTVDGTAVAGTDYTAAAGVLAIPANSSNATIAVTLTPASGAPIDRTFQLVLDGALGRGAAPEFSSPTIVPVGAAPRSLRIADINGDGRADVLELHSGDDTMSVLINTTPAGAGTATYATAVVFATGDAPSTLTIADINHDGRPDALVANLFSASVSVLVNTTPVGATMPSFAPQQVFPLGISGVRGIDVADFNGDGLPDVCATYDDNAPAPGTAVLLNATAPGASTIIFEPAQTFPTGATPWDISAADLNGDGRADIIVGDWGSSQLWVLLNTTSPGATTAAFQPQAFATGLHPHAAAAADMDGDGKPDIVVANDGDQQIAVLRNTTPAGATTASFAAQQVFDVPPHPVNFVVVDLNGDGRKDIAVSDFTSFGVSILLNSTIGDDGVFAFEDQPVLAASYPGSLTTADIDADGRADLVFSDELASNVWTLLNRTPVGGPLPGFSPAGTFATGSEPIHATAADFNADGRSDLVVANYASNSVSILLNETSSGEVDAQFAAPQVFPTDPNPVQIATPDINGDGRPDIAAATFLGPVSVLLDTTGAGASPASFSPVQSFSTGEGSANSIAAADFDRDGRPDLAIADSGLMTVKVFRNETDPGATAAAFAAYQAFPVGWPFFVTAADLNLDGAVDLIVANLPDDTVSVLLNSTMPGSTPLSFLPPQEFPVGHAPRSIVAMDVNGDGKIDLMVANRDDGTLSPLLNITTPGATSLAFLSGAPIPAGAHTYAERAFDANADGRPDVVATDQAGSTAAILLNATAPGAFDATFNSQTAFEVGPYPYSAASVDVNNDGHPDLAVPSMIGDTVSILFNTQHRVTITAMSATATIFSDTIFSNGFE